MNFNVDFHYHFDTAELRYSLVGISSDRLYVPQDELWYRHPDLTLLAIL